DPDQHLRLVSALTQLSADHRVQPGDPGHPLGQPCLGQRAPGLVHQLDVVMILRPIVSHEQQLDLSHLAVIGSVGSVREKSQRPNERVLTPQVAGTTSHQRFLLPGEPAGATIWAKDSTSSPGSTSAHPPAATGNESAG